MSAVDATRGLNADMAIARLVADEREPVVFWSEGRALVEAWAGEKPIRYRKVWTADTIARAAQLASSVEPGDGA